MAVRLSWPTIQPHARLQQQEHIRTYWIKNFDTTMQHGKSSMKSAANIAAINTKGAPQPIGPFSQAVKVRNAQELLFISGQLPINPATNVMETDAAQAAQQCMENCAAILQAAGMDFSNVVKTTILLADINDFAIVNKVYESFLQAPYPARATFQAAALPRGARVEIEMVAVT